MCLNACLSAQCVGVCVCEHLFMGVCILLSASGHFCVRLCAPATAPVCVYLSIGRLRSLHYCPFSHELLEHICINPCTQDRKWSSKEYVGEKKWSQLTPERQTAHMECATRCKRSRKSSSESCSNSGTTSPRRNGHEANG